MSRDNTGTERRPNGAAFIIAALLAVGGSVLIWQAGTIPDKGGYAGIGSATAPKFIGFCLLALAIGHVVQGLRSGSTTDSPRPHFVPVLWVIAGLALQLVLLRPLGFSIASGLLFAFTAAGFGKTKLALTVPIGIGLALLIYGVFDQLLQLKLPAGVLENLIFGG